MRSVIRTVKNIVRFFTFSGIPIWQKLLLFASGGIGWFIIIALIGLIAISSVSRSSKELTDRIMPQIQTGQKVIIQLRGANVSVHNIVIHDDIQFLESNIKRGRVLLDRAGEAANALLEGGYIRDYSDLTGELIEEITVMPLAGDERGERFIRDVEANTHKLREILDNLASAKLQLLRQENTEPGNTSVVRSSLAEYDQLTVKSVTALGKYTSHVSALQQQYVTGINSVLSRSMVLVVAIGLIAVVLLIFFSILLKGSITNPLKAITRQIKVLSEGEVDLTKQITVASRDEIGELSGSFNRLMHTIHDMSTFKKIIEEDDTLGDVYNRLGKVFHEELGLQDILIYESADKKNTMEIVRTPYSLDEQCCNKEILIDSNLCRARKTGHVVSSLQYPDVCKQFLLTPEKFHVCLPIIVGGTVGGVVQFQFDKARSDENEEPRPILDASCIDRQVLKADQYIKESSAVIEAKRLTGALKESAIRDQMTGLYNRRFLEEYVDTLVAGTMRKKGMLGLLMCDLDYFKEVNDKYGHDVGDMVLRETSNIIAKNARSSDMVIRFGGEEFLVILTDAKDGNASETAERIRKKIEATQIRISGGFIQKTISIGYSEFPRDTQNFWEAIKYADIALYKAKEAGRNKVLRFAKEMWTKATY